MTTLDTAPDGLDVGIVVQTTFSVLQRNFVTFLALAAIFSGVPALLAGWAEMGALRGVMTGDVSSASLTGLRNVPGSLAASLISIVANAILQGALIHITTADLTGRRASVTDGLATGLRNFLPLIGIGILYGLGVIGGCLLLVVPGLMLAVMWSVTVPCQIVERTTVFSSFTRSRILTQGSRWRIFGLAVIFVIIAFVIQAVLNAIFGGPPAMLLGRPLALVGVVGAAVLNGMIGAVGVAVLYTELRRLRDGVGVTELAAVFD